MSSTSNVPSLTITSTGVTVPQTTDVLTGVLEDLNIAFGGNLNTTNAGTPQGYLAENITNYLQTFNSALAYTLNQIDPLYAEGRWQDAIGRLYFLTRNPATPTIVLCTLTGTSGSTIPVGSLATDGTYNYSLSGSVTFPSGGTLVDVEFICTTSGAIACPAGSLNRIAQAVSGWDAITNPANGIVGTDLENRTDFEIRRQQAVAGYADSSTQSILGEVVQVKNVVDCYVHENFTGSTIVVGATSVSIAAHSIYIAVSGGTDLDVATAIWNKKSIGCSLVGSTTVSVTDTSSLSFPQPVYSIKFQRPASLPIYMSVNISNVPSVPATYQEDIKAAIDAAFNGTDGGDRVRIGSDLYASRFYAGISAISPYIKIVSIFIGTSASPTATEVLVGIDKLPTINPTHIVITLV